jgi:hypothetical protein
VKNATTKIIVIFVILVAAFAIYTKWDYLSNYVSGVLGSGDTKIFKVAGNDIGPYVNGDNVIAEKDTFKKRDPQVGDIVVYQKTVNNTITESMGTIAGLPSSTTKGQYAPAGYYLIEKNDKIEVVPRDKITWLVFRKAL